MKLEKRGLGLFELGDKNVQATYSKNLNKKRESVKINLFTNFKNMEIKNEIDKLAEMMQREFGVVQKRSEATDNKIDGLKSEVNELKNEMNEKFDRVDERFDEVLGREDKIFKSLSDLETDNTMGAGASKRHDDKLKNHEERIVVAEEKLGIGATA